VSPFAPYDRLGAVRTLLGNAGLAASVSESPLTRYSSFIPTDDELKRFVR